MKQLREKMRNRLRVIALIILGFVALSAFAAGDNAGKIFGGLIGVTMATGAAGAVLTDEQKVFLGVVEQKMTEQVQKLMTSTMTSDQFNSKIAEIEQKYGGQVKQEDFDKLKATAEAQGAAINKLKEMGLLDGRKTGFKTLGGQITEAYVKHIDLAKQAKSSREIKTIEFELDLKGVASMTRANSNSDMPYATLEPGLTNIQSRRPFLRGIVNVAGTSAAIIYFAEKSGREGAAGATGEGTAKNQIDFNIVVSSQAVKKITAFINVSTEMLEDIDFMANEINNELMEQVELEFDGQILSGDGLTTEMKGILTYLTSEMSVAGTVFDASVTNANQMDVLRAAVALIVNSNFLPNYIIMNPLDAANMELQKGDDGQYLLPPFMDQSGKRIAGVPIIENSGITAGTFLVGDFTKSNLRIKKDMYLEIGLNGDDFKNNLRTILCELRAAHYIKTNHLDAFRRGTFATLMAAMESGDGA